MLSIYQLKPKFQALLRPYANALYKANFTANQVTLIAGFGSIFIAFIVGVLAKYQWIFFLIPIWMFIRMALNAIDGIRGIKDWGNLISGHGGVLDRLDSVCFAAPIFFHLVRYFWV
ncbi:MULTISPECIES: phosphatidate cytidylyltransferase [unclassified Gilliamella]|uniref:phosphatidate cytidylyltransferase n=1 Tax=unclassified Gilliamella TaxID=2685620 RepID=UPI00080E60F7|nr:phosphatidate cytidylyltransferase [Gilliamella apicola]OCG34728.1 hypothetical protein A9G32_08175 [Gilliamella apicola]OCG47743.1 hypothetical protein A9G26_11565 [Gilliamella apicola]OCG51335.1 hypothetical protein A9G27_12315 [Gilliamella apicola]